MHELKPSQVFVYQISGSACELFTEELKKFLSNEELARVQVAQNLTFARQFIYSRGSLRLILGSVLKQDPRALCIRQEPNQKPVLEVSEQTQVLERVETEVVTDSGTAARKQLPIYFNVSHSQRGGEFQLLVAVSGDRAVGVDIENQVRFQGLPLQLAKRFFSNEEYRLLESTQDEAQRTELYSRLWVRKEAFAKAIGDGLSVGLDRIQVMNETGEVGLPILWNQQFYQIQDLPLRDQWTGALCAVGLPWSVSQIEFDAEGFGEILASVLNLQIIN